MNAGNTDVDLKHLNQLLESEFKGKDVRYEHLTDRSLVALQGPKAAQMLQQLVKEDLTKVAFMSIFNARLKHLDIDAIICRCGYTGEDGFEISIKNQDAIKFSDYLFKNNSNLVPAGLAARDSVRLEAGLCLHGNEMTQEISPVEAGLMWIVRKSNIAEPFLGQEALNAIKKVASGDEGRERLEAGGFQVGGEQRPQDRHVHIRRKRQEDRPRHFGHL